MTKQERIDEFNEKYNYKITKKPFTKAYVISFKEKGILLWQLWDCLDILTEAKQIMEMEGE